jgi:hypothetical protein
MNAYHIICETLTRKAIKKTGRVLTKRRKYKGYSKPKIRKNIKARKRKVKAPTGLIQHADELASGLTQSKDD